MKEQLGSALWNLLVYAETTKDLDKKKECVNIEKGIMKEGKKNDC